MEAKFNHFDHNGNAVMVDVSDKAVTERTAVASGKIRVNDAVMQAILQGTAKKGDVLGVARVAGIMATKQTSSLIPMCHLLCLSCLLLSHSKQILRICASCCVHGHAHSHKSGHGTAAIGCRCLHGINLAAYQACCCRVRIRSHCIFFPLRQFLSLIIRNA